MSSALTKKVSAITEKGLAIVRTSPMPIPKHNRIRPFIQRVMKEKGLKQKDVLAKAKELKRPIPTSTFAQLYTEDEQRLTDNPGIYTLADVANALGVEFEELINEALGETAIDPASFNRTKFGRLALMYDQLHNKKFADRFIEMLERELSEMLKQQEESK